MGNFEILKHTDAVRWNTYIQRLPVDQQDIYYTPQYYNLYENYGDGEARCFVFEQNGEVALYPFLINSVNTLGYELEHEYFDIQGAYGYNGVVASSYQPDFIDGFYKKFGEWCIQTNVVAEFTRFHPLIENNQFSNNYLSIVYDRKTVWLDISKSIDDIWNFSYSSSNRNMIRKARKKNIEIFESTKIEDYQAFYNIYVKTMDNVGSEAHLYFNQDYFLDFVRLLSSNHRLILAKLNDEIIGGMILMLYQNFAHYHLSARKSEFGSFAINNLFLDYAIKVAQSNNCKKIHFGGGTTSDEKDSLLRFKANFSQNKAMFYFGKKVHNDLVYEQLVIQWKEKFQNSYGRTCNRLLGYREI